MTSPVEAAIGYSFRQRGLLEEALTHPSSGKPYSNQRLEFLGDTVVGLLVARLLFRLFPTEKEGELARRHAALVCGESLVAYARDIELGGHIIMAEGEVQGGGRDNPTNLEDACEALIGAVYLDGGMEAVERCFLPYFEAQAKATLTPPKDPKTALQEWAQAKGLKLPEYRLLAAEGPAHAPVFTVEVQVEGGTRISATATTKRMAEREAARLLMEHVEKGESA